MLLLRRSREHNLEGQPNPLALAPHMPNPEMKWWFWIQLRELMGFVGIQWQGALSELWLAREKQWWWWQQLGLSTVLAASELSWFILSHHQKMLLTNGLECPGDRAQEQWQGAHVGQLNYLISEFGMCEAGGWACFSQQDAQEHWYRHTPYHCLSVM